MIMPQMDGVEFIEWLGSERANVRLVVVTGFNPNYGRLAEKLAEARGLSSVVVLTNQCGWQRSTGRCAVMSTDPP
jgi:hypothetical protein